MNLYLLLLHLAGGVTLLLWAVRMVRTGVERSQEPQLRRLLRESKGGRIKAAGIGAGIAVVLQSSTAVALLAAGFAGSGILTVATGLALMLGADLGSALVVQILSVDIHWVVPVLLIAGGVLFFKGWSREWKQGGRVLIAAEDWPKYKLQITSDNNFPTAAGLASSASGFACLSTSLSARSLLCMRSGT